MRDPIKFKFAGLFMKLAVCAVFGLAAMLLWNELMPQLFALPQISYLQAVGLLILARLLFGGIGGGGWRHHHHGRHEARDKLREKLMGMKFNKHFGDEGMKPHGENSEKKETNNE